MNYTALQYYQNYHKHTSLSHRYAKDSPLTYQQYFNDIKERFNDVPQIYSTVEHGWQSPYFRIYDDLEKFNKKNNTNIKFVFGTEMYWVKDRFKKDNSNCHIILLARNDKGRKAINKAISIAYKTGYYYKGRMDMKLLLSLPKDDVFVTTACVAFWNKYEDIDDIVYQLNNHFTHFYLEVQAHNTPSQKQVNQHILELSNKWNIPIIAGTDSHVITNSQLEDRDDLLRSSDIHYEDEDGWYMDCPDLNTFISRFQEQGILNEEQIHTAIDNTNKILGFEDIILDRSLKVPVLKKYQNLSLEERNDIFVNILRREWVNQKGDINQSKFDEYIAEIKQDIKEIEGCNMADYFIDNYEIIKRGIEVYNGKLTPSGRGSAVSMYINKLLRFTKVDRINSPVLMYPERFLTKERVLESKTPPDIDHNVSDREPFIQAQRDLLGELGTYDLLAVGTLHYKSAFKMYARAYNLNPQIANEVTKQITKYENALKHAEEDEKDLIDIFQYVDKEKYGELIDGCQTYRGIVDNLKSHPCGTICFDGDVETDIGIIMCKSESTGREVFTAVIESGTIDSFGYLKQDYLIVDSIGLIYDIYDEIGIEPMTVNELLEKIDGDKKVWDIYKKGYTMCINQCEQEKTTKKVMTFSPKNIAELTQFVAGIRPSFQSMYKIFESREHFEYGIKAFDNLLQDEYCSSSFILYQETLMKVLGFAGFPMKDTYTIIKAISKKKDYIIKDAKKKFIPNFAQAILDTKETTDINKANNMAKKVWQIIEDSASYGFNSAHAYSMAIDSVTLAYLKAYYPLEFYKVVLQRYTNKGDKDKVSAIKREMFKLGVELKPIKFRDDNRQFSIDKEKGYIAQTMASIKNISKLTPEQLYEMGKLEFNNIFDLLEYLFDNTSLNVTNRDILIKLDYFSEFGDINKLLYAMDIYTKFATSKVLTKSKLTPFELSCAMECCGKETEKQLRELDNNKLLSLLMNVDIPQSTTLDKMKYQVKLLGYTDIIEPNENDELYIVENIEINQYGTPWITLYHICDGISETLKINKRYYKEYPCEVGDILRCSFREQNKRIKVNGEWVQSDEIEKILKVYSVQ